MKIVFLSHTPRNSIFKVGSFHLSNAFAKMGHDVLYIPSVLSAFHFLNIPGLRDEDYRNTLKSRLQTLRAVRDEQGVINLTPFVLTPFNKGIFDRPGIPLNQEFTFNRIDQKLKTIGFDRADLVIQDKAGLFFMRKFIRTGTWIYRATDDYSAMPRGPGRKSIQRLEKIICRFADRVLVTSEPLRQLFADRYGTKAVVLRNGVDVPHFTAPYSQPDEYVYNGKPVILYVGSLDQRFDLDLLLEITRKNLDYHYMIIGPGSEEIIPADASNITVLGPKPYRNIPAYMQHADVGILPLKMTEANHARSPMKIYEYGICGLPIVSTPLRELQSRNEKFVVFGGDATRFYEQICYCLEHKERLSEIARQSSGNHSWNSAAKRILELSGFSPEEVA